MYPQIKSCCSKSLANELKELEKIENFVFDKQLVSNLYKNLYMHPPRPYGNREYDYHLCIILILNVQ